MSIVIARANVAKIAGLIELYNSHPMAIHRNEALAFTVVRPNDNARPTGMLSIGGGRIVTMVPEPVLIASARPNYLTMCYRFNSGKAAIDWLKNRIADLDTRATKVVDKANTRIIKALNRSVEAYKMNSKEEYVKYMAEVQMNTNVSNKFKGIK